MPARTRRTTHRVGPPGAEREARKSANDPLLTKRITTELGNVSRSRGSRPLHRGRAGEHGREHGQHDHQQRVVQLQRGQAPRLAEGLGPARRLLAQGGRRAGDGAAPQGLLPGRGAALRGAHLGARRRAEDRQRRGPRPPLDARARARPGQSEREELHDRAVLLDAQRGVNRQHRPGRVPCRRRLPSPTTASGARSTP